jgi:exonuclease III
LQEVKANYEQLDKKDIEEINALGYEIYWNAAVRP